MVSFDPTDFMVMMCWINMITHVDELEALFSGQALELYWKFQRQCPSMSDYLGMVDNKTGGYFRLVVRIIAAEASSPVPRDNNLVHFMTLLGRYYQIRDDLQNLVSEEVSLQDAAWARLNVCRGFRLGMYAIFV